MIFKEKVLQPMEDDRKQAKIQPHEKGKKKAADYTYHQTISNYFRDKISK